MLMLWGNLLFAVLASFIFLLPFWLISSYRLIANLDGLIKFFCFHEVLLLFILNFRYNLNLWWNVSNTNIWYICCQAVLVSINLMAVSKRYIIRLKLEQAVSLYLLLLCKWYLLLCSIVPNLFLCKIFLESPRTNFYFPTDQFLLNIFINRLIFHLAINFFIYYLSIIYFFFLSVFIFSFVFLFVNLFINLYTFI